MSRYRVLLAVLVALLVGVAIGFVLATGRSDADLESPREENAVLRELNGTLEQQLGDINAVLDRPGGE